MYYGNRQGGSVATFIVVGLVLVALACGALYGARQYMVSQRTAPISEESMQSAPSDDSSDETTDNSTESNSEDKNNSTDESTEKSDSNSEESKDEATDSDETKDETNSTSGSTDTTDDQTDVASLDSDDSEDPLPQTGPTTDAFVALTFGITAMATVAYVRSQRMI